MSRIAFDADLILAKGATVRDCIGAIRRVWARAGDDLEPWIVRDVVVLNLQRSIQALADLGQHLVAANDWGLPASTGEAFATLAGHGVISAEQANLARSMIGFRNIAVHEYRRLDDEILRQLVDTRLDELEALAAQIATATVGR